MSLHGRRLSVCILRRASWYCSMPVTVIASCAIHLTPTNLAKIYLKIMVNYGNSFPNKKSPQNQPRLAWFWGEVKF